MKDACTQDGDLLVIDKAQESPQHPNCRCVMAPEVGEFDISQYLQYEAFEALTSVTEFMNISNGGYFVEWECGADLSADTLEAQWKVTGKVANKAMV